VNINPNVTVDITGATMIIDIDVSIRFIACHCDCYLLFKINNLNLYILNLLSCVKTLKLKFNIDSDKVCYLISIKCAHYKYQYRY